MTYEAKQDYLKDAAFQLADPEEILGEMETLLERDAALRPQLTDAQRKTLMDEEVVDQLEDGWAGTSMGIYITADGERIFGPGSGRSPGDAKDQAALTGS